MMATATTLTLSLSTTHWVIDRVHSHAPYFRTPAEPTATARLATRNIHMIGVSDLSDGGISVFVNTANFTGRHPHQSITAFAVIQHGLLTGAPSDLSTSAR